MLEIRNLSKVYTQRGRAPVKALTDINISFPEKGMVFLLGKSGSGKSTLLNICSGLDSPSTGEIIVKGRSSKDFSQDDFDSYRNTFVGFVFQEYNILEEFSVGENISLALELQDKPKDNAVIEKILEDIGLKGFAERNPSTLSGGEKQRIAIARALVKNPEIVMADEPSGALDSETGTAIFEILKKMSRDKLIIVVSHDREFAEQYGDRIIELKDGKVISDVSKVTESQIAVTENIEYVGNLLHIRNGAMLNPGEFKTLQNIFSETHREIIVAIDEEDVKELKKSKNVSSSGTREFFQKSIEGEKKKYQPEDSIFISSKLPFKHALKIGASSLKNKPIRLAFTTILCVAAFTLFGLLSTMLLYNSGSSFKKTLRKSHLDVVSIHKEYAVHIDAYKDNKFNASYQKPIETNFSVEDLKTLKTVYGNEIFGGVSIPNKLWIKDTQWAYWNNKIRAIAHITSDNSIYQTINGRYPKNDDEICISSYMANVLYHCNAYDEKGTLMDLEKAEDVINKKIILSNKIYTITGIFNCGDLPEKFDDLKTELIHTNNWKLLNEFEATLEDGLYLVLFTTESGVREIADKNKNNQNGLKSYQSVSLAMESDFLYTDQKYKKIAYKEFSQLPKGITMHSFDEEVTSLGVNEVIIYEKMFYEIVLDIYSQRKIKTEDANEIQRYSEIESLCREQLNGTMSENKTHNLTLIIECLKQDNIDLTVYIRPYDIEQSKTFGEDIELRVVAFWEADLMLEDKSVLYVSETVENAIMETQKQDMTYYEMHSTKYVNNLEAFYSDIFLPYDHSSKQTQKYTELYKNDEYRQDDTRVKLSGAFIDNLEAVDQTVQEMSKAFLILGVVLAIFAALLLSNFISVSIFQKQKEIGVLRAMGAKGTEVFKIFFVETLIIVLACIIVSSISSVVICHVINGIMSKSIGAELFIFGIGPFVLLTLISIITAFLATYCPVNNAAKKKPIESIRTI